MESDHGLNQSTNFMGLMNSQQGGGYPQTISFDSLYPTIPFLSSQVPLFSSQVSSAPSESEDTPASRRGRKKWTPSDDRILISGWLNKSKDVVVGNDQKGGTFWKRVADYFSESTLSDDNEKIWPIQCKQRWAKIGDMVGKFCVTYAAAVRAKASGQNEDDIMKLSYEMYYNIYQKKFILEHCWLELHYDQKWCELLNGKAPEVSNKRRLFDDPAQSSASQTCGNIDEPTNKRLSGRDASKAKQRKTHAEAKEGKALKECQSMWEIKKEDLRLKERLSKMQILDSLLAKKGPLTQKEEAIKEKMLDLVDD